MLKRLTLCGLLISSTVLSPFVYAQDVSVVDGQVETTIVQLIVSEEAPNTTQIVNEPIVTQVEEPVATADVPFESENGEISEISEISLEPIIVDGQVETTIVQPIVSEEAPNTTQVVNESIVTQVEEPVVAAEVPFESENGEISEISLEPMIVDVKDDVNTTEKVVTETIVETIEVEITEAVVDQITEPVIAEQTMTPTNVNYVPQTTVVAQTVPTIYYPQIINKEIEQVENKPIGTLKRLGVSDPSKPVGKLTRLMQILPETGSLNGDTGIITGVVMLMSAIILSLYGFGKRIFN